MAELVSEQQQGQEQQQQEKLSEQIISAKVRAPPTAAAKKQDDDETTGQRQPEYTVSNFNQTIIDIIEADKALSSAQPPGWPVTDPGDESILDWKTCKGEEAKIPRIKYLSNIGEANGKEHGKRFEENLKLVVSVALSKTSDGNYPLLGLGDSNEIIAKIQYGKAKRKFKTIPISPIFFLEETEHKNDEKDIDTNQVLNRNVGEFTKVTRDEQKQLNDELKTNTKWFWNYDSDEMKHLRAMAGDFMGSGMNIKCAQMSKREIWSETNQMVAWPNPIDCADCMTFLRETSKGNFIFVVGVWEYASDKNIKCLQGVWFINMLPTDFPLLWGGVNPDEVEDVSSKITALKRFNKVRGSKSKKIRSQRQNATLKALYYYGNIDDARKRCGDGFDEDEAKAEKMAYGGCIPLLNTIKDKLTEAAAYIRLTPKVQVTKAQARLQCNISTANFKKLVDVKQASGNAIYSEEFNYLFRPIRLKDSKLIGSSTAAALAKSTTTEEGKIPAKKTVMNGGGFIQKGGNRNEYNQWLRDNNYSESETDFFFDIWGNSYGYPIMCHPSLKDSLMAHNNCGDDDIIKNANVILNKLTLFQIPDFIKLELDERDKAENKFQELARRYIAMKTRVATRETKIDAEAEEAEEEEEEDYIEVQEGFEKHGKILNKLGENIKSQLEELSELMSPFIKVNEMPDKNRGQRRARRSSSQTASEEYKKINFSDLQQALERYDINIDDSMDVKILRKYHFALKILRHFPRGKKAIKREFMENVRNGYKNNYKLLTELVNRAYTAMEGTSSAVPDKITEILNLVKQVDPPLGGGGGIRKKRTRKKRRKKKKSRRKRRK